LYPDSMYLKHASIESSELMNLYSGNVILNDTGEAWINLPDWFEALNKDFTYQLSCIGGFAQVYIAKEIENNKFKVAGGSPGLKVSWQVTGIRHDKSAEENPLQVEQLKILK
jgi:trimeric autotransporter adhesin